ncbi:MAG: HAMP domain-containing histidine kinase [Alphaproteobacteria bacterium]|nr:HAMP domain-containing histidine kinase [Alphaproteobacteria bacterium]
MPSDTMTTVTTSTTGGGGPAPPRRPPRPFNIRLWFALVSFAVICALGGTFGYLMSEFIAARLLYREAELTQEFLQSIVRAEHTARDIFQPDAPDWKESLESFTDHMVGLPGVFRANLYAMDRRILWSTDVQVVGRRFTDNRELDLASRGELFTEIKHVDDVKTKEEHEALVIQGSRHFIEAYIPLRDANHEVVGVVEIYKSPVALEATIQRAQEIIWAAVVVGAAVLYGALYWVVRRGAQVIERQSQQLTTMETMAALGQMAGAIAHSLRNPLAGLRSSAELIAVGDVAMVKEGVRDILAEADRMDRHIRDLLSFTRAERAVTEPVDPVAVARACITDARPAIERRRIAVTIDDPKATGARVAADSAMLRQAITSIVSNALEAMADGGRLEIRARQGVASGRVILEIADNGRGMSAEVLSRVATPFFTTKAQGLGLGLALARRIVERYGGTLGLESKLGRGTIVTLDFPTMQ